MKPRARAVIVGGGVGGAAIAYWLARLGWEDVVLCERAELTSGSTFHSAGLVGQLRGSLSLTKMMMSSVDLYRTLEEEVGLETTLKRPLVNTRDEPHADPQRYRRLHVIAGDANLCEVATFLKVGTTATVLAMIEDDYITKDLSIVGPVAAVRTVSHDPTCRATIELLDGGRLTAVELQWE